MADPTPLFIGDVSRRVDVALRALDDQLTAALNAAKVHGVPQGLIVGLLHGHAHRETAEMIEGHRDA